MSCLSAKGGTRVGWGRVCCGVFWEHSCCCFGWRWGCRCLLVGCAAWVGRWRFSHFGSSVCLGELYLWLRRFVNSRWWFGGVIGVFWLMFYGWRWLWFVHAGCVLRWLVIHGWWYLWLDCVIHVICLKGGGLVACLIWGCELVGV